MAGRAKKKLAGSEVANEGSQANYINTSLTVLNIQVNSLRPKM